MFIIFVCESYYGFGLSLDTRVRTRMFLVQNVRVAMQKLPRFQGQTFQNVNSRMTIGQTEKFSLGNVAVSAKQRVRFARETYAFESRVSKLNPKP